MQLTGAGTPTAARTVRSLDPAAEGIRSATNRLESEIGRLKNLVVLPRETWTQASAAAKMARRAVSSGDLDTAKHWQQILTEFRDGIAAEFETRDAASSRHQKLSAELTTYEKGAPKTDKKSLEKTREALKKAAAALKSGDIEAANGKNDEAEELMKPLRLRGQTSPTRDEKRTGS